MDINSLFFSVVQQVQLGMRYNRRFDGDECRIGEALVEALNKSPIGRHRVIRWQTTVPVMFGLARERFPIFPLLWSSCHGYNHK